MNLVVTDTGPLLHLTQIGSVELLGHLGIVHVTPVVWNELHRHAPDCFRDGPPVWLVKIQPSANALQQASQWVCAKVLDAGEAEALAYAQEIGADLFLTDDAAARTFGETLGLHVRGTLGVILHSAALGHVDRATCLQILHNLEQRSTLWMSAKVKAATRNALSQIFGMV